MFFEEFLEGCSLHDHRWYQKLMILAFGWFGWCLPSSFCPRGHMVWKMLFEEFQDGCLVHGHYWYVIGWFKLFWISMLQSASHQVSAWDNLWVGRCCLKIIKMSFSFELTGMIWFVLSLHVALFIPINFCIRQYMVGRSCLKNSKKAVYCHDHL